MRVFLTGGTGFVGRRIVRALLDRGDEVVVVSRDPSSAKLPTPVKLVEGDPTVAGPWMDAVPECEGAINLAGEPIVGARWTEERKQKLIGSRVFGTRNLVEAMGRAGSRTRVLVSTSAVGYYGPSGDHVLDESSHPGHDFLADLCQSWELEARRAAELYHKRSVQIRVGVVLGLGGGALEKMVAPFKAFVGGPLGSGAQWTSFIHVDDLAALYLFALDDGRASGPMNGTAPNPCTMKDLCQSLGKALHRPSWLPAPAFAIKLAFGESSTVLLDGQKVIPKQAEDLGFSFRHPTIDDALTNLFLR